MCFPTDPFIPCKSNSFSYLKGFGRREEDRDKERGSGLFNWAFAPRNFCSQFKQKLLIQDKGNNPGGGGYLGQFLLGMCRWPLRTQLLTNWPIIDPILVTFGLMYFSRSQLSHFLFMPRPYRAFQVGHPKMNWHEFVKFNVEHCSPTAQTFWYRC